MDALALAERMRCSVWTARRTLAVWFAQRGSDRVPHVELRRSGGRGRPAYRVDPESYALWRRGLPTVTAAQIAA